MYGEIPPKAKPQIAGDQRRQRDVPEQFGERNASFAQAKGRKEVIAFHPDEQRRAHGQQQIRS